MSAATGSERLTFEWLARRMALWLLTLLFAVGSACALYATAGAREATSAVTSAPTAPVVVTGSIHAPSRQ